MGGPDGLRVRPSDAVLGCVLSGPGETLALGLHAHMRVFELGGWDLGFGDFLDSPWEGS